MLVMGGSEEENQDMLTILQPLTRDYAEGVGCTKRFPFELLGEEPLRQMGKAVWRRDAGGGCRTRDRRWVRRCPQLSSMSNEPNIILGLLPICSTSILCYLKDFITLADGNTVDQC